MFNSKKVKELELRINEMEKQLTSLSLHNKATDEALAKTGEALKCDADEFKKITDSLSETNHRLDEIAKKLTEKATKKKSIQ